MVQVSSYGGRRPRGCESAGRCRRKNRGRANPSRFPTDCMYTDNLMVMIPFTTASSVVSSEASFERIHSPFFDSNKKKPSEYCRGFRSQTTGSVERPSRRHPKMRLETLEHDRQKDDSRREIYASKNVYTSKYFDKVYGRGGSLSVRELTS